MLFIDGLDCLLIVDCWVVCIINFLIPLLLLACFDLGLLLDLLSTKRTVVCFLVVLFMYDICGCVLLLGWFELFVCGLAACVVVVLRFNALDFCVCFLLICLYFYWFVIPLVGLLFM